MAKKLTSVASIMEQESKGFANRAAGKSENGIITDATNTVIVKNETIEAEDNISKDAADIVKETDKKVAKGRPKKSEKLRRERRVMVYLTEDMFEALNNVANEENISLNQTIIFALKKYLEK